MSLNIREKIKDTWLEILLLALIYLGAFALGLQIVGYIVRNMI